MTSFNIHRGMSLREALLVARELGAHVSSTVTGEVRVSFELRSGKRRRFNINGRRHDVTPELMTFMRKRAASGGGQ